MKTEKDYTKMQMDYYNNTTSLMKVENHAVHNQNQDYWNILLSHLNNSSDNSKKVVLDFGCGCGRNVINLLEKFNLKEVHGCDISHTNIEYCNQLLTELKLKNFNFFVSDGSSLSPAKNDTYDFIMSTIVLQHIPVYNIRKNILKDMFRVLKNDGVLSFQMGFGSGNPYSVEYYENHVNAAGTNGACDVRVTDEKQLIDDLKEIGFTNIKTTISHSWSDNHKEWIYVECMKK
jgi:ubiquinone/menaquinone biosynthesis C-methylase UbiE